MHHCKFELFPCASAKEFPDYAPHSTRFNLLMRARRHGKETVVLVVDQEGIRLKIGHNGWMNGYITDRVASFQLLYGYR